MGLLIAFSILVIAATLITCGSVYQARGIRRLVRQRVIVHTKTGHSIGGILVGEFTDCLRLEEPKYLGENADLSGEAVVLRSDISWLQVLDAEEAI